MQRTMLGCVVLCILLDKGNCKKQVDRVVFGIDDSLLLGLLCIPTSAGFQPTLAE